MHDRNMTPRQWQQRAHFIDAMVKSTLDNISTADFYEDEWRLRIDATEAADARLFNRTTSPNNMVAR